MSDETKAVETKPLEQMTKAELYEVATEIDLVGRKALNRDELEAAVRAALLERAEAEGAGGELPELPNLPAESGADTGEESEEGEEGDLEVPESNIGDGSEEGDDEIGDDDELELEAGANETVVPPTERDPLASIDGGVLLPPELTPTDEQLRKIRHADSSALVLAAVDQEIPEFLRVPIRAELERRKEEDRQRAAQAALRSEIKQYRVTKGGRFVTNTGYITQLPENSVLSHMTHDLHEVAKQGIEFEPLRESFMGETPLGVPQHIVR